MRSMLLPKVRPIRPTDVPNEALLIDSMTETFTRLENSLFEVEAVVISR